MLAEDATLWVRDTGLSAAAALVARVPALPAPDPTDPLLTARCGERGAALHRPWVVLQERGPELRASDSFIMGRMAACP